MRASRLAQTVTAACAATFRLTRVLAATSADDLGLALFVAGPMGALVLVGLLLFPANRAPRTDKLLLALTLVLAAFSTLVFLWIGPNDSGSSIVYMVIPAYEFLGLLLLVALWLVGRRLTRSGRNAGSR